jgi:lipopolysaccharide exporter
MAMANAFVLLSDLVSRMGVGPALVQRSHVNAQVVRVATGLALLMGAIGTIIVAALAPLVAAVYGDPAVTPIVRTLSLTIFCASAGLVGDSLLRRNLKFARVATVEVSAYAVGYIGVGLALGVAGAGVWSLVWASIAQSATKGVWFWMLSGHRSSRVAIDSRIAKSLLGFGAKYSAIQALRWLSLSLPPVLLGRFLGASAVGQFNRADLLAQVPMERVMGPIARVLFPAFSEARLEQGRLERAYELGLRIVTSTLLPLAAWLAVASPVVVTIVLGPGWSAAAAVLPFLVIASSVIQVSKIAGAALEALDRLGARIAFEVGGIVLLAGGLLVLGDRGLVGRGVRDTVQ